MGQVPPPTTYDTTFNHTGVACYSGIGTAWSFANDLVIQPDGKIVLGGSANGIGPPGPDFGLLRLNPNGTVDSTFGTNGHFTHSFSAEDDYIQNLVLQPDGKILAFGQKNVFNGTDYVIARFTANGAFDPSFGSGGYVIKSVGVQSDIAGGMCLLPNGKILICGASPNIVVLQYNSDGTPDNMFGTNGMVTLTSGTTYQFSAGDMVVQANGKILICGSNLGNSFVIRLQPNGALDNSFGTGGFSQNVPVEVASGIALQSNGKIVICGQAITPSMDTQYAIFRVNLNGTIDSTFGTNGLVVDAYQPGLQGNEAWDVIIQADGKILICGSHYNGITNRATIARFNSDGSPDISITPSGGAIILSAYLFAAMQYQNDGKLVAVGISTVPAGEFTATRLWMGFNFGVSLPELENGGIVIYPNPFSDVLHVHLDKEYNGEVLLTDAIGRTVRHSKFVRRDISIETASLPAGAYFLTIFSGNQMMTRKIVSVNK